MKRFLQNTSILLLAGFLIIATGGFSIYHHFCGCAGESSASIFMETTCNHHRPSGQAPASCCSNELKKSCCMNQPEEKQADACHKDNCCHTSSTYLKIMDNFTISVEKISLKFIVSFLQILTGIEFQDETQTSVLVNYGFNDTSPPLYGTELLHSIHQLKIAHFLA